MNDILIHVMQWATPGYMRIVDSFADSVALGIKSMYTCWGFWLVQQMERRTMHDRLELHEAQKHNHELLYARGHQSQHIRFYAYGPFPEHDSAGLLHLQLLQ